MNCGSRPREGINVGHYLDLIRDTACAPSSGTTCDRSDISDKSELRSLSSLMPIRDALSDRRTSSPSGVDTSDAGHPPCTQPSQGAWVDQGSSRTESILEISASTKATKTTKPAQQSGAKAARAFAIETTPVLLFPDGRRLHRFHAHDIPATVPDDVRELIDQAHSNGTVLVPDGCELIVVERRERGMSSEALMVLGAKAGAIIAALRSESRARCARTIPGRR